MTYGELALRHALDEVGVREVPANSNSGPRVRQYQAATSLHGSGWPWCAAFVLWCYRQAGAAQPFPSASAGALRDYYRKTHRVEQLHEVKPGDLCFFEWEHDDWPDHVGLVRHLPVHDPQRGWLVDTVEGNTAPDEHGSQGNGGCVAAKTRSTALIVAFARPVSSRLPVDQKHLVTHRRPVHKIVGKRGSKNARVYGAAEYAKQPGLWLSGLRKAPW